MGTRAAPAVSRAIDLLLLTIGYVLIVLGVVSFIAAAFALKVVNEDLYSKIGVLRYHLVDVGFGLLLGGIFLRLVVAGDRMGQRPIPNDAWGPLSAALGFASWVWLATEADNYVNHMSFLPYVPAILGMGSALRAWQFGAQPKILIIGALVCAVPALFAVFIFMGMTR